MTLETARRAAITYLAQLHQGIDPLEERRRGEATALAADDASSRQQVTLREVFESFALTRKDIRTRTIEGYRWLLETHCDEWLDKPISQLDRDNVESKHAAICAGVAARRRNVLANGFHSANATMRVVRLTWNYGVAREMIGEERTNPVSILSRVRAWYPQTRRTRVIKNGDLSKFYAEVLRVPNTSTRDLILLMLFTGLRREEALALRWSEVDLQERMIHLPSSRTKGRRPLDLPMSGYVIELFSGRRTIPGAWVFPGNGKEGHMTDVRGALNCITRNAEIPACTPHELRRTFITVGESCDISWYALKGLVNHGAGTDVTGGYIHLTGERLRDASQRVTDKLSMLVGRLKVRATRKRKRAA